MFRNFAAPRHDLSGAGALLRIITRMIRDFFRSPTREFMPSPFHEWRTLAIIAHENAVVGRLIVGILAAPTSFGTFASVILIGNFYEGTINALTQPEASWSAQRLICESGADLGGFGGLRESNSGGK
jgi:hypothetical protein